MNNKKLLSLIRKREGIKLDFKLKLNLDVESCKKELSKDVCAIANSRGGRGYIIVGIEDKTKKIVGLSDLKDMEEEKIQQIITSRCEPPIPITVDIIKLDDKDIGVITIYDGGQKPYQIKESGAFYIRRGSTNDTMRRQELVAAFEENFTFNIETCPIINSSIDFLNMKLISKYFESKGIYINKDNEEFLLQSSGITYLEKSTKRMTCTFGGLLVFSDINSVCIPHNMVKIIDNYSDNKTNVTCITGKLIDIIDKVNDVINSILPREYPTYAVMEAIKNAVLYREYSMVNRVIEVRITKKVIIVISPGQLIINNDRVYNVEYNKRNMWIYDKMIALDGKSRFINDGRGIQRIKNAFKGRGEVKLINSVFDECFKVILPLQLNNKDEVNK